MSLKILFVEDDSELRRTLLEALRLEGYTVHPSASLADAQAQIHHASQVHVPFDLCIVDLGLPDGSGRDLIATLLQQHTAPIVVISAQPDERQKIQLLDLGVDDYLVKPFGTGELLARMRVALRHRGRHVAKAITHYEHGALDIDLHHRVVQKNAQVVHLTPLEYDLLARLVRSAGQTVTHRQLLHDVWGSEFTEHTHYLRLYMAQLRAKIEDKPAEPHYLLTETGVGYRLALP